MTDGIIAYFSVVTIVSKGFREEILFSPHEIGSPGFLLNRVIFSSLERRENVVWSGIDSASPIKEDIDSRKPSVCLSPSL